MKPIKFKETNMKYIADDCEDLPVYRNSDGIISCWRGGLIQRLRFLLTGKMWFAVEGSTHPPVWMHTENPFKAQEKKQ